MIIKYKFANGDVSMVEVSEDVGEVIVDSRKKEHANNEKQRYHCYSSDAAYEGMDYAAPHTLESFLDECEANKHISECFEKLSETQKRRILKVAMGMSLCEIAKEEKVNARAVFESVEAARKNFLKNF
ncbi:MAG: hypothetical protein IKU08_00800 [Clostridia bacterium]|nr:hypothetical protein [Clostridia bacterium]